MKALIVDDERLARNELKRLLGDFPALEIIGEARNGDEAQEMIEALRPEVVFLDIQMPGKDVFQLLEDLSAAPLVVFTTAYDEYALKAFEANALDYVLKPIDPARLSAAVKKILDRGQERQQIARETLFLKEDEQVFVKDGERCWFVRVKDIRLLESEGNYTRLYFDNHKPLLLRSLSYLEERFDPQIFFRAGRRHIVNLNWVERVEPTVNGGLALFIRGALEVPVSRRQAQVFKEMKSL